MELEWEYQQEIGSGTQPVAYHSPGQVCQVLYINPNDNSRIYIRTTPTPFGEWHDRVFSAPALGARDVNVEHLKMRWAPATDLYAMWKSGNRHRLSIFALYRIVTDYLVDGTLSLSQDSPVVTLGLTLENPAWRISSEEESIASPGARIVLEFTAGSSEPYLMGTYYVDRNDMAVLDPHVKLSARNITGKLLKEQTFDNKNKYARQNFSNLLKAVLDEAAVPAYEVEHNSEIRGMNFPPNKTYYDGLLELLAFVPNWQITETLDGIVVVGSPEYAHMPQPGTHEFSRDEDCWSRSVTRDDREVYARVCAHTEDFSVTAYSEIQFIGDWNLPEYKTLFAQVADGTSQEEAQIYADALAEKLGAVGVVETFAGSFKPHLMPGDEARIIDRWDDRILIGVVTEIRHHFGRSGYTTEFTVDSGGALGKGRISGLVTDLARKLKIAPARWEPEPPPEES